MHLENLCSLIVGKRGADVCESLKSPAGIFMVVTSDSCGLSSSSDVALKAIPKTRRCELKLWVCVDSPWVDVFAVVDADTAALHEDENSVFHKQR